MDASYNWLRSSIGQEQPKGLVVVSPCSVTPIVIIVSHVYSVNWLLLGDDRFIFWPVLTSLKALYHYYLVSILHTAIKVGLKVGFKPLSVKNYPSVLLVLEVLVIYKFIYPFH